MIRYTSQKQLTIEEFKTLFEIKLSRENRWVKLAEALPWDELAKIYHRALSSTKGRQSVGARIVIGAFIIKHKEYQYASVFDSSLSRSDPLGICNNTQTSWSRSIRCNDIRVDASGKSNTSDDTGRAKRQTDESRV
jgi:hypothetical protein